MTFYHPSDRNVRASDVVEAGHRGHSELVEAAVDHDDPAVRAAAASALLRLGALDVARWAAFASDESEAVRRRAAELAPRLPAAKDAEPALVGLLEDSDEIVEVAAFALGEIGSADNNQLDNATVERLETIVCNHSDALCREAAVASLGALHRGLETILQACGDKATVRRRAIISLAPFDGPEVTAALTHALNDRDWQVRQAAEDLLALEEDAAGETDPS